MAMCIIAVYDGGGGRCGRGRKKHEIR